MSHYTVLASVTLPEDLSTVILGPPVTPETPVASVVASEPLPSMSGDLKRLLLLLRGTIKSRFEEAVERLVDERLEPYYEATDKYLTFYDMTQEGQTQYETKGVDCVRMPDGRVVPVYDDHFYRLYELHEGKVYKRRYGPLHHRKRTKKAKRLRVLPNYPFKKLYPTYEAFMEDYHDGSFDEEKGAYGFWHNPNAKWDWYQIGGRWPLRLLVKDDCELAALGEVSFMFDKAPDRKGPDGYKWVAGARKCDIAWDVMKEVLLSAEEQRFHQFEAWIASGKSPKEAWSYNITEEGIVCLGDLAYRKNESLDDYIERQGLSEEFKHPISTFAYVGDAGWQSSGDMGWFGMSYNDKDPLDWNRMVEKFITELPDDAFLVSVDCHI